MPYIIDEIVMFDEVKGSLSNIETKDEITLPPTAGCILLILFSNDSIPIERSQFIKQVYTKFGFDLSNNTLNQYISLLRKNIRNLGVEPEVIITVPRVGFYISSDIKIARVADNFTESAELQSVSGKSKNRKISTTKIIMGLIIISEVICLLLFGHPDIEKYPLKKSGRIEACDLYLPVNLERVQSKDSEKYAAKLAERYLPCTPGSVFIYDINALKFLNGTGKVYLSRCTGAPGENRFAVCSEVMLNEEE